MKHTPDEELAVLITAYREAVLAMELQDSVVRLLSGTNTVRLRTAERELTTYRDGVFSLRMRLWDLAGKKPPRTSAELNRPPWGDEPTRCNDDESLS